MATLPKRPFEDLAHELAAMPALIARLLLAHPCDGICPGCTTPGGRTVIDAPCPIRKLALMAAKMQEMPGGPWGMPTSRTDEA